MTHLIGSNSSPSKYSPVRKSFVGGSGDSICPAQWIQRDVLLVNPSPKMIQNGTRKMGMSENGVYPQL